MLCPICSGVVVEKEARYFKGRLYYQSDRCALCGREITPVAFHDAEVSGYLASLAFYNHVSMSRMLELIVKHMMDDYPVEPPTVIGDKSDAGHKGKEG